MYIHIYVYIYINIYIMHERERGTSRRTFDKDPKDIRH